MSPAIASVALLGIGFLLVYAVITTPKPEPRRLVWRPAPFDLDLVISQMREEAAHLGHSDYQDFDRSMALRHRPELEDWLATYQRRSTSHPTLRDAADSLHARALANLERPRRVR